MKVLMISTDRKIFEEGSAVRERMVEYSALAEELHVLVFSKDKRKPENLAGNVWVYSTASFSRFLYVFNAYKVGRSILAARPGRSWVVSSQDPFETGLVGYFVSRSGRAGFHIQIHTDFLSPYFKQLSILNRVRVLVAKIILAKAKNIRVVSLRIKNSIIRNYKFASLDSKISILPIWVDKEKFKKQPVIDLHKKYPQFKFVVLMASRLTKEKNIALGIDAFAVALIKDQRIGLVIVGSGREEAALRTYVSEKGIDKNVIFEPWSLDLNSYYKTADVFFLSSDYEGYGLTLAEAALSGTPIVTTDVGITGSILRNNVEVLVSAVRDLNSLAQNLVDLVRNPTLSANISSAAFERIQASLVSKNVYIMCYKETLVAAVLS